MSFSKFALVGALASVAQVAAHGTVTGIVAGGTYFPGYSPNFQYQQVQPIVVGWSIPQDQDNGFIAPSAFGNPDVICHKGATNAQTSAPIAAGGEVELQWSVWPVSHKGPVINYLANCGGDCTKVDKTTLKWFKIAESGLIDGSVAPGKWASDELIANNNSQTITIPSNIAAGNYVLRHEIIALHSAGQADGAQAYPQCINLEITGGGSAAPAGVLGTALYTATDPGILVNIYQTLTSYAIPGPALFSGSGSSAPVASSAAAPASTSVVASVVLSTGGAAPVTSLPNAAVTGSAPTFTGAPFGNATSTRTRSAKKTRTANTKVQASATSVASPQVVSTTQIDVQTEVKTSTVAASNPEATATVAPTPVSGNTPTTTAAVPSATASVKAMPAGTTLTELLTWLKDMVTDILGGNTAAISKRAHARDLATVQ